MISGWLSAVFPLVTIPNYFCSQNHLVTTIISHSSFLRLFILFNKSLVKFPPFSLCYSPSVPAQPGIFAALSEKEIFLRITTAPWEVLIAPTLLHPIPAQPSILHLQCLASSFFPSEKCLSFSMPMSIKAETKTLKAATYPLKLTRHIISSSSTDSQNPHKLVSTPHFCSL